MGDRGLDFLQMPLPADPRMLFLFKEEKQEKHRPKYHTFKNFWTSFSISISLIKFEELEKFVMVSLILIIMSEFQVKID